MKIGIDIDGCMIDEDEYRLSYMSKYCFEHGLPEPDLPHAYEHNASWWDWEMEHAYRPHYHNDYYRNGARIPVQVFLTQIIFYLSLKHSVFTENQDTKLSCHNLYSPL